VITMAAAVVIVLLPQCDDIADLVASAVKG